jgi:hypothetical protein
VLAARIDRLAPVEKRLLQTAAVIGHEVPLCLLQAIAELPEDMLQRGLAHMQASEFLYETRSFPALAYTFKHALTHEVAYGSLLREQRRVLHARIVEALGRVALAVFRPASENAWPSAPAAAVRHLLPPVPPSVPDELGMFSWGDPARVQRIVEGAGFRAVTLTPVHLACQLAGAGGAAEATAFALLFGPLTRRMAGVSAEQREAVRATLEDVFQSYVTP